MADQYTIQAAPTTATGGITYQSGESIILGTGSYLRSGQTDYDAGVGFWLGNQAGVPKFSIGDSSGDNLTWNGTSLDITGVITATSGTIGGFTIGATTITATNLTLDSSGQRISLGSANNIVILDADDATYRLWVGNATAASAPFRVEADGGLVASDATITGSITSTSGTIGGWTLGSTTLTGGNVTLDSTGNVRAGQTAYNTGTGFWLGIDGGTPKFSIGNSAGVKLTWDGTNLTGAGTLTWSTADLTLSSLTTNLIQNTTGVITVEAAGTIRIDNDDGVNTNNIELVTAGQVEINSADPIIVHNTIRLGTNDAGALGSATSSWSDLFLASGGVINWNNGNYTATHSAGLLTLSGALTITGAVIASDTLTVNGAFTSLGIDDNASGERMQIGDTTVEFGTSGNPFTLRHPVDDQRLIIRGGNTTTTGAFVELFGGTHATQAHDFRLGANNSNIIVWDESAAALSILGGIAADTGTVTYGTYTPTLTGVANVTGSTAYQTQYMRVGKVVTVSGRLDVDPTAVSTLTQLGISLPIASNLASTVDCCGTACANGIASESAAILGDGTNNRAEMRWITVSANNHTMFYTFTYLIT